jgi:protein-L-isoaspartate(D-aspartate) O-methyltransferase
MADDLAQKGLLPPAWREAFQTVPRHLFLPRYFRLAADNMRYEAAAAGDPGWLDAIYHNSVLPTQLDGDDTRWEQARQTGVPIEGTPTSSSTMPSLMAAMLAALDLRGGLRVLEIGTGTGYNAAVLSHRLGSGLVTTTDVDPALVEQARRNLARAGYSPTVAATDGTTGYPPNAPYDRIIASASVPAIPPAWLEQATPGAVIVTHLYRDLGGDALIRLTVGAHGTAEGHFLADYGNFMPVRSHRGPDALHRLSQTLGEEGDTRPVSTPITGDEDGEPYLTFAALMLPGVTRLAFQSDDGGSELWLFTTDSWACRNITANTVEQHGPRRLWDELEKAHAQWEAIGEPDRSRLGLTVTPDGTHRLWIDSPSNTITFL